MKSIMNNYTIQGKDKLGIFTVEYSRDMDELGKAIRNLVEKETNQSTNRKKRSWEIYSTS